MKSTKGKRRLTVGDIRKAVKILRNARPVILRNGRKRNEL